MLARAHTLDAVHVLVEIAINGQSESARVSAATSLLDRGWGKPPQALEMQNSHNGGEDVINLVMDAEGQVTKLFD